MSSSGTIEYDIGYLAGPMGGLPDENRPAFAVAAEEIRADRLCRTLISPHEGGAAPDDFVLESREQGVIVANTRLYRALLRRGIQNVLLADVVFVLGGWEASNGAQHEVAVARAIGTPVFEWPHYQGRLVPVQDVLVGWDLDFRVVQRPHPADSAATKKLGHDVRTRKPVLDRERDQA